MTDAFIFCLINDIQSLSESTPSFIKTSTGGYGRQAARPVIYEKNGSVYVIKIDSLRKQKINDFEKVHIYEMSKEYSIDLDEPLDWIFAEAIFNAGLV